MVDEGGNGDDAVDIDALPAGDGGFPEVVEGDEDLGPPALDGGDGHAEDAADGPDIPGEGDLPDEGHVLGFGGDIAAGFINRREDGELHRGALFLFVGGGEVDHDIGGGDGEAALFGAGEDALFALADGGVRQSDDGEIGHPPFRGAFDGDLEAVRAVSSGSIGDGNQKIRLPFRVFSPLFYHKRFRRARGAGKSVLF